MPYLRLLKSATLGFTSFSANLRNLACAGFFICVYLPGYFGVMPMFFQVKA